MIIICKPGKAVPEYTITQQELLDALHVRHTGETDLALKLRLANNTTVQQRHFISPLQNMLSHDGIHNRVERYISEGTSLALEAISQALDHAHLVASDIHHLIVTSCTPPGLVLPGLDAYIVNTLGLFNARRLPIAQMGCHAGATALAQAHSYLLGHPHENVLVCAVELCSLNEQPGDTEISSFVSRGLFGDGAYAAVVRDHDNCTGLHMLATSQYIVPHTLDHMYYEIDEYGNHFNTKAEVVPGLKKGFPAVHAFLKAQEYKASDLTFLVSHTGGPRVMDAVITELGVDERLITASRESLRAVGNLSSATVFDVLYRTFETYRPHNHALGLLLGFGPGSTIEMILCRWREC